MEILKTAVAGTIESSDIMITIEPNESDLIELNLESSVEKQFGRQISDLIKKTLKQLDVQNAKITAIDKGALDCTIQARTITAVYRAAAPSNMNWEEIDLWND